MKPKRHYKEYSIVFIPTWSCDNTCSHCFEKIGLGQISPDAWDSLWRRLLDFVKLHHTKKLKLYWQGGEILTLDHKQVAGELGKLKAFFKDKDCAIEHHFQTNLIAYHDGWAPIIAKYFRGSISTSLDYPNLYRHSPSISIKNYNNHWLRKKRVAEKAGLTVSLISLPNTETLKHGAKKFYHYYRDVIQIKNLQVNFPFPGVNGRDPRPMNLKKFGDFLEDLYHIWITEGRTLNLSPFVMLEETLAGNHERGLPCMWSNNCAHSLFAVAPDGETGQCDCWVSTLHDFSFGNLFHDPLLKILHSKKRNRFLKRPAKMIDDPECSVCDYWKICHGGCPIRAQTFNGDMFSRDYYCPVYKRIFNMVIKQMRIQKINL
ncbi:MAG: radical SAM protein [Deltaproteobacteria bacterium]|nr:radical SAM protein [Deltaproteobacteria bacterium]